MSASTPTVLVLAPMPALPPSAGNRKRLLATCEALRRGGFAVDLAYWAHEDQIYRRFGQHPPTDCAAMQAAFQRLFLIEPRGLVRLTTRATHFPIDAWCPDEVGDFVAWYYARHPETRAILVNYVFLSRALERAPAGVLRLIDTHDRFAGRRAQYRPFKAEPNFFYTDAAGEAAGLNRADIILAIQSEEARHFEALTTRKVQVLPPYFPLRGSPHRPERIARIGFLGHGNDPNVFSLEAFARAWTADWTSDRPELVVAGEICQTVAAAGRPGLCPLGFIERIEDFYEGVDLVVAPMLMGTGLKMKVAEALSHGLPVIGTSLAFEGFDPVDPAHRCRDAEEVKSRVLALAGDRAGLAALSEASAALFARYNRAAVAAERAFLTLLRERTTPVKPHAIPAEAARADEARNGGAVATAGDRLTIAQERSTRSLPSMLDGHGVLVATERRPPDGSEAGYSPLRRRWYARASAPMDAPPRFPALDGQQVALSPEWLHGRELGEARPLLARAFAGIAADWEATGRVVGTGDGRIEIVLGLPSFLARGRHPALAFLIAPGCEPAELRLDTLMPLQVALGPNGPRPVSPEGLPLVPAAAGFLYGGAEPARDGREGMESVSPPLPHPEGPKRSGGAAPPPLRSRQPSFETADAPPWNRDGTADGILLVLTDDCLGRVYIAGELSS